MKEILLSKSGTNKGKYVALVDDEDFDFINQWNWSCVKGGTKDKPIFYAARRMKNRTPSIIWMHRVIMKTENGMLVDPQDHNGLNNQKLNLRNSTNSQNSANRKSKVGSSSNYLGVSFNRKDRVWRAFCKKNGTIHYAGRYKLEADAAKAYNQKAFELHGEFANLNQL